MCLNEFFWSVSVAIRHFRQHYAYIQASHSSCIRVFPAPSHMAEVLWCSFETIWSADFRNMFRETCQVEAGSVTVKWSVLVDRKVSLVSTEVHFASTVACIFFFKLQIRVPYIIGFYKTTLTGVLHTFGDGWPWVLTERPSYNRSPAPDLFSVPSKNEKYDKVQNDYPVVEVEIVLQ